MCINSFYACSSSTIVFCDWYLLRRGHLFRVCRAGLDALLGWYFTAVHTPVLKENCLKRKWDKIKDTFSSSGIRYTPAILCKY